MTTENITQTILDGKIYAHVVSVAKSWMSRRIKFYLVEDWQIVNVSNEIADVTGNKYDWDKGIFVSGCGMHMIFATLYNYLLNKGYKHADWSQRYNML